MKLRAAMIFAKDLDRMTRFYRDGLGLASAREEDGWVELDGVALHAVPPTIAAGIAITEPPVARESTPIKLVFEVAELATARTHLASHGAVMFEPRPWGTCDGLDPEGNVLQIVQATAPGTSGSEGA